MEPKKVGRALGIGVRVASKMVRQRMAEAPSAPAGGEIPRTDPFLTANSPAATSPPAFRPPSNASRNIRTAAAKRGLRAFGDAILGPFTHAGGVLWLEVTGLFFALFALFFVQNIYRVHSAWRSGPDHAHFILYVLLAVAFGWFSVSSFSRAYRKNKRPPGARQKA